MVELGGRNRQKYARLFLVMSLFAISFFTIVSSVMLNVYLHELGHYAVADYYGLDPEMHISGVVEMGSEGVRMNLNPEAYVRYRDPGDTWKNILITAAGPFMNLVLLGFFVALQISLRRILMRKANVSRRYGRKSSEIRYMRICLLSDIIFMSMAVPSLLSVVMNLTNTPGSDGAYLRQLFRQL